MKNITNSPILFLHKYTLSEPISASHESFDFIYVLSGECQLDTLRKSGIYSPGDICLLNPHQDYTLTARHVTAILHMGISADFFHDYLSGYCFLSCDSVSEPGNDYTQIKNLFVSIAAVYAENSQNILHIQGLLLLLLNELKKNSPDFISKEQLAYIPHRYHERIAQIMDYINLHYHEPLSLSKLSAALFLSPQYVSYFLKKYVGSSFKKILNERRLSQAEHELRYTDSPITEIALRCGFSNTNTFYKNFCANYHKSPQEYRRIKAMPSSCTDSRANFLIDTPSLAEVAASAQSQPVSINMEYTEKSFKDICTMINIGRAHNLLSRKFQSALLSACQHFHFRYIRMQELISNALIPRILPNYEYFFQNIGIAITFLYQNNLIPFVELSQHYQQYLSPISTPRASLRSERFFQLFEHFLSYCAAHWPTDWLSKWQFELWFSPKDTLEKYISDLKRIKELLNRYFPGAGVGGPGFDYCFSSYKLETVLSELCSKEIRLDFISIHLNYFTQDDEILQISTDRKLLLKRCQKIRKMIDTYCIGVPLYATEWSSAYIPDLPVSQSRYQAVFICKSILDLQNHCDMLGYWIFMDDLSSRLDGSVEYDYWDQGLLSTDFIKFPAFYAFDMIKENGHHIVSIGSNYLITQKSAGHYYAIAFNYSHFDETHTGIVTQSYHFENIYDVLETAPDIQIEFKLYGLPPGFYRITRRFLNKYHGSYLDILIGEYTHSNIERIEFLQYTREPFDIQNNYCLQACIPEERTIYISVNNVLTVPSTIPVHCICTWDIQKISGAATKSITHY